MDKHVGNSRIVCGFALLCFWGGKILRFSLLTPWRCGTSSIGPRYTSVSWADATTTIEQHFPNHWSWPGTGSQKKTDGSHIKQKPECFGEHFIFSGNSTMQVNFDESINWDEPYFYKQCHTVLGGGGASPQNYDIKSLTITFFLLKNCKWKNRQH